MSDCFRPEPCGIGFQVDDLAQAQRATGHEVLVATSTPGEALPGLVRVGIRLPWGLVPGSARTVVGEFQPDVVHVHTGVVSPFAWRALRECREVPLVVTVHSLWGRPAGLAHRRLIPAGAAVTTVSEAAARPIRRVLDGEIQVVPNGIDTAPWREIRPWLPTGAVHVVSVGGLTARKEPLTLLRILRSAGVRTRIRATIVGDGPAEPAIRRYLRRHRMDAWVRLTGRLDRAEVREVLASADVFLAPARRESFGLAALEARLAGVPVVAHAAGGVADFVRPETEGLLGRDTAELSHALVRMVTDHHLRHTIAAHNRSGVAERCSWPAVLGAFDGIYASLTGTPPVPTATTGAPRDEPRRQPGLYLVGAAEPADPGRRTDGPDAIV